MELPRDFSRGITTPLFRGRLQTRPAHQFTRDAAERPRRRFCFLRKGLARWDAGRGVSALPRGHHPTVGLRERRSPDRGQSLSVSPRDPCGGYEGVGSAVARPTGEVGTRERGRPPSSCPRRLTPRRGREPITPVALHQFEATPTRQLPFGRSRWRRPGGSALRSARRLPA